MTTMRARAIHRNMQAAAVSASRGRLSQGCDTTQSQMHDVPLVYRWLNSALPEIRVSLVAAATVPMLPVDVSWHPLRAKVKPGCRGPPGPSLQGRRGWTGRPTR